MGKRKEVGIYGSSKKKRGLHIRDPKLKQRRRKIKKVVVNKGKRPVMRFGTTSESSDSGKNYLPSNMISSFSSLIAQVHDTLSMFGSLIYTVVWRGLTPLAEVTADDIVSLLHHKPLKGKVIDAWAELMNHKYAAGPRSNKTTIFTSSCWTLIDNRLEGSLQDDVLLFPLNTKGSGRMARDSGLHWTLLMLDVKNFSWRFFNTIRGRTYKTVDVRLRRSEKVMMYVEDKMKEFYKAVRADHPFLDNTFTKTEVTECIQ
ncbi:hypothetical protein OROGR_008208 [Orobanche gracilis]